MKTKRLLCRVTLLFLICLMPVLSGCSTTRMILQAERGRTQKVERMLDKGIDVDSTLVDRSALFYASQNGHVKTVKLLLNRGANPNLEDAEGIAPLRLAAETGHLDILNILLDAGADPNTKTKEYGNLALHIACWKGYIDIVSVLLDKGDHLNLKNHIGMTPLMMAARHGHDDIVKMLIEKGANIELTDKNNLTALHYACVHGKGEMVPALLAARANPNAKTVNGLTPLHMAACQRKFYRGRDDYLHRKKLLVAAGADPNILSNELQLADDLHAGKRRRSVSTADFQDSADVTAAMSLMW